MNSFQYRNKATFLRNGLETNNNYGIPLIQPQNIQLDNLGLIGFNKTKLHDSESNSSKGIHFYLDDYQFERVYSNPYRYIDKLSRYRFVLSLDFSLYSEMPVWRQIENVAKNRWCGSFWQNNGIKVIPTISWSNSSSFSHCFMGVAQKSIVSISTVGCRQYGRYRFMVGYEAMLQKLKPRAIICYGKAFPEMKGNIIEVPYQN